MISVSIDIEISSMFYLCLDAECMPTWSVSVCHYQSFKMEQKDQLEDQYFRFTWNTFDVNMTLSSQELFKEGSFTDVTLVSEDLQVSAAHRFVLSRASSTFKKLLLINPSANSMLYLRGISQNVLDLILQFIYTGEVDVPTNEITDFLKAANDLDISELKNRPESSNISTQSEDTETSDYFQDIQEKECKALISTNDDIKQETEVTVEETESLKEMAQKKNEDCPSFIAEVENYPVQDVRIREIISNKATRQKSHKDIQSKSKQFSKTMMNPKNTFSKSKNVKAMVMVCTLCSKSFNGQLSYLRHMRLGHK